MKKARLFNPRRWHLAWQCLTTRDIMVITSDNSTLLAGTNFYDIFARYCMRMTSKTFYKARVDQERARRGRK